MKPSYALHHCLGLLTLSSRLVSPFALRFYLQQLGNVLGGHVHTIITGSAPLSEETQSFIKAAFCCDVIQGYGLTETAAGATAMIKADVSKVPMHIPAVLIR